MSDLLRQLYDKVIYYEQEHIETGKRIDEEVHNLVELYNGRLDEQELEKLKNLMYSVVYTAQYEGFKSGARAVIQMLMEIL